jgi:hypothetical protein
MYKELQRAKSSGELVKMTKNIYDKYENIVVKDRKALSDFKLLGEVREGSVLPVC